MIGLKMNYMRVKYLLIISFLFFLLPACMSNPWRTTIAYPTKIDTLLIQHDECTECLDGYILTGQITYPDSMKAMYNDRKDIKLAGSSPYEDESVGSSIYHYKILITGFLCRIDSGNAIGQVPVFYVIDWKKKERKN